MTVYTVDMLVKCHRLEGC